jgi:DNA (cytosine-5)-methyltransferase 1
MKKKNTLRFIDLFAGLGGTRIGFERAAKKLGIKTQCVFTSEIKDAAIETYAKNFNDSNIHGDISKISAKEIPDFDMLLAGFPCQPFSFSGKREGFADTRGTLFFEIERILKEKKPQLFLLENVEGLVTHDKENRKDEIGRTLSTILKSLTDLGYKVSWSLLNSANFNVAQERKRIYITGSLIKAADLKGFEKKTAALESILENNCPLLETTFTKKLLAHLPACELHGKAIKDKRGGKENIHSWDFELKGSVSKIQKELLNTMLKERRKKKWAEIKGIKWMDGMPLTQKEIESFFGHKLKGIKLKDALEDLVSKKYIKYEYPKNIVELVDENGNKKQARKYDETKEKGYNIVTGKLSFEISKILNPQNYTPTLVATDMNKLAVIDNDKIRKLTIREGLRLFGFPENYSIDLREDKAYDLLGNSIVVPVVEAVCGRILKTID